MYVTYRSIKTRFRCASTYRLKLATYTKSLTHYTKGTPSELNAPPTACKHSVSGSLSLPLQGFFSPFPHGTRPLSVNQQYLALESGLPIFRQNSSCSALLKNNQFSFPYGIITLFDRPFHVVPVPSLIIHRLVRFRSPLLSESRLISFPAGTQMFQFPAFAPYTLSIRVKVTIAGRVSPFGYPRISAYSQLPAAFRSVSRPSSPLIAKASTKCSYHSLDSSSCINNLSSIHSLSKIYPLFILQIKVYYTFSYRFF